MTKRCQINPVIFKFSSQKFKMTMMRLTVVDFMTIPVIIMRQPRCRSARPTQIWPASDHSKGDHPYLTKPQKYLTIWQHLTQMTCEIHMWMVRSGKAHQLRPIAEVASKLIEIIIGIQPNQGISYSNVMIQVSLITKEWPKLVSWVKKSKHFTF